MGETFESGIKGYIEAIGEGQERYWNGLNAPQEIINTLPLYICKDKATAHKVVEEALKKGINFIVGYHEHLCGVACGEVKFIPLGILHYIAVCGAVKQPRYSAYLTPFVYHSVDSVRWDLAHAENWGIMVSRKEVICEEDESIEWDKELIRGRIMK
jgi:hypothetical protein